LPEGKLISIIGQSGSGKSTLLSLLAGLESADSGSINLTQQNLSKMNEKQRTQFRAKNISIVFQQYHLMPHLTALENVMLPLEILKKENAKSQALAMLTELGLDHRANHLPSQMSGGECQRVAIARALVVRPKLLLADEPSGNLDVKTGDKVMDVFFKVVKKFNITTVLVTHSPELAARCDSTWQLESGLLKEQST
jgi:putative ABC transport system ATP-binding protein